MSSWASRAPKCSRAPSRGFSDIVEGIVYALLIRIEQREFVGVEMVSSEKGPPRKVCSINELGRDQPTDFWGTWSALADRIEQLREREASL